MGKILLRYDVHNGEEGQVKPLLCFDLLIGKKRLNISFQ